MDAVTLNQLIREKEHLEYVVRMKLICYSCKARMLERINEIRELIEKAGAVVV